MNVIRKINGRVVTEAEWEAAGQRHKEIFGDKIAEMCERQQFPGVRTNDTFMRGKKAGNQLADEFDKTTYVEYQRMAARAGVSVEGKHYYGSLADYAGEPSAWCGSDSEVKALAKKKKVRLELNGQVYDYRDKYGDAPQSVEVADDIVDRDTERHIAENYGADAVKLSAKQRAKIRKEIKQAITPEV